MSALLRLLYFQDSADNVELDKISNIDYLVLK